jgi:hypothetical protein
MMQLGSCRVTSTPASWLGLVLGGCLWAASFGVAWGQESQVWHVKAVHPDGYLLKVKAIGPNDEQYDVKAIRQSGNRHLLDVKAFVEDQVLPVKVLAQDDWFGPVKAIGPDGMIFAIKALTESGEKLDVKAVSRAGSVLDIKAIGPNRHFFGVKAISPEGHVYDIKGLKMVDDPVEMAIGDVEIRAHIKGVPQVD